MSKYDEFKRAKRINYRCSMIAMVLTQAVLFTFNLSLFANIAGYIINTVSWVAVGAVLEAVAAVHYGVDLTQSKKGEKKL